MRSYEVFASMSPERAVDMMRVLKKGSPGMFRQAVDAAAVSIKARPVYMRRQPFEKRAEAIRRALARVVANPVADELLAVYFLQCRKELLTAWLDELGLKHEDGALEDDSPEAPKPDALKTSIERFLAVDDDKDRDLLLRAFAAQGAIEWPDLDAYLKGTPAL